MLLRINQLLFTFSVRRRQLSATIAAWLETSPLGILMLPQDLRDKLRHNTFVNLWDGSLFGFGVSGLASYVTIIPLFLSFLTESTALIGFVATLFHIGWQVPQLLTSSYVASMRRYKPMVLAATLAERVPYFGLALLALAIPAIGIDIALILVLILLTLQSLAGGFTGTAWQSMISKIMPPHRPRRLLRHSIRLCQSFWRGRRLARQLHSGTAGLPRKFFAPLHTCRHKPVWCLSWVWL